MKKIAVLSAAYGEGHNAAARALVAGFVASGAEAEFVDSFRAGVGDGLYDLSRKAYLGLINRAPRIWAAVYRMIDKTPAVGGISPLLRGVRKALERDLAARQPNALVSTYPVYNYLLAESAFRTLPRFTVVTDSITINSVWHRCESRLFFVPNEDSAQVMRDAGVPAAKLRARGFPVPLAFSQGAARRAPVEGEPLKVLFMVNAGRRMAPAIVERLLAMPEVALAVTVGRDEALGRDLEAVARRLGKPLEIFGWTPRMPELLMTHHVLVGKAGGAAVQESIAARTPMIITHVVPGQEEGNARLLVEHGCGAVCETPEEMAALLRRLQAKGAREWQEWEMRIAQLSRPRAAVEIAEEILREIGGSHAAEADAEAARML